MAANSNNQTISAHHMSSDGRDATAAPNGEIASFLEKKAEIAFLDTAVEGWETLAAGVRSSRPDIEIGLLDATRGELDQMAEWASAHAGYGAIHLLSHGDEGQLRFGGETMTRETLSMPRAQAALAAIGQSLKESGELLIYGCNVAKGAEGRRFVADLAARVGAKVAASTDFIGSSALGGKWALEATTGAMTTNALRVDGFAGLLGELAPTLTVTLDRNIDPDSSYFALSAVGLSSGVIAVEWGKDTSGEIEFLSTTGSVLATTALTGVAFAQYEGGDSFFSALSNGNVVLTYDGHDGKAYFSIISQSGVVLNPTLLTSAGADAEQAAQLSNGDLAVSYIAGGNFFINYYNATTGALLSSPAQLEIAGVGGTIIANASGGFALLYSTNGTQNVSLGFYTNGASTATKTVSLGAVGFD